jgi:malate permease and related proteins
MWVIFASILWMALGCLAFKAFPMPKNLPHLLSRSLYWVGIPLQIMALAHRADFSHPLWLPTLTTLVALFLGIGLALLSLQASRGGAIYNFNVAKLHFLLLRPVIEFSTSEFYEDYPGRYEEQKTSRNLFLNIPTFLEKLRRSNSGLLSTLAHQSLSNLIPQRRAGQGSFVLASMMSNAGYMGLAIAPAFVSQSYWSWIAIYHIINNLLGFFVFGVLLASYFGRSQQCSGWTLLQNILIVPALWAFVIGWYTRDVQLPAFIEASLQSSRWLVNFSAFLLTGLQLSQLRDLTSLKRALVPTTLKVIILPALIGFGLTLIGLTGDARFSMALMAGTPTAFTAIILAEKYDLDRQITANSILLSTLIFPLTILLWVALFK